MKKQNFIFIFVIIFTLVCIALMNFFVDPYKVFLKKDVMDFNCIPQNNANIMIKGYKNQKYDTLIIGGSETRSLYHFLVDFYKFYFNLASITYSSYEKQYFILKNYLKFHPETKNVFFFISVYSLNSDTIITDEEIKTGYYNLKELFFLLFSAYTSKKSFQIIYGNNFYIYAIRNEYLNFLEYLKDRKRNKKINNVENKLKIKTNLFFNFYNKRNPIQYNNNQIISIFNNNYEKNIFYIKKSIELLKEKNINFYIIIPPSHAMAQSFIYMNYDIQTKYEKIKKICVENADNRVYDFSIINDYTQSDYEKNNYLYEDSTHANFIYGLKIFKLFHDNIYENRLYIKLNRKEFDKQIEYERNLVKEYINKNIKMLSKYPFKQDNLMESEIVYFDNAPDYIKKEIDLYKYNFEKIIENYYLGKIEPGKFNNKFYTETEN